MICSININISNIILKIYNENLIKIDNFCAFIIGIIVNFINMLLIMVFALIIKDKTFNLLL